MIIILLPLIIKINIKNSSNFIFFFHLSQFVVKLFVCLFFLFSITSQVPTKEKKKKEIKKKQELIFTREIKLYRQMCCAHRIVQEKKNRAKRSTHTKPKN
jgi:Na+/melibiose symporter-like transporter